MTSPWMLITWPVGDVSKQNLWLWLRLADLSVIFSPSYIGFLLKGRGHLPEDLCSMLVVVGQVCVCLCVRMTFISSRQGCDRRGTHCAHMSNGLQMKWCFPKVHVCCRGAKLSTKVYSVKTKRNWKMWTCKKKIFSPHIHWNEAIRSCPVLVKYHRSS